MKTFYPKSFTPEHHETSFYARAALLL